MINLLVIKPFYVLIKLFFTPSEKSIKKLKFKGKFKVRTDDNKSFFLYNNGFFLENSIFWLGMENFKWEFMTRKIWVHLSNSSKVIFDIGANTGIYAILAKVYNPKSKIFAFEPQPNIYNVLKKNNQINHFDISCENIAISNEEGEVPFFNYGSKSFSKNNTTAGSLNKNWRTKNQHSILVSVNKLGNYIKEKKINRADLIKIDVETFEFEVLEGLDEFIELFKPIIILEIQNQYIGSNISSLLSKKHYSFFNIDEKNGLKLTQNLGGDEKHRNYLICPNTKMGIVKNFIFKN
tara:strand:- start:1296 stop:2174 length:879 start_codon:yes stop_codon:yes gene_type:complete